MNKDLPEPAAQRAGQNADLPEKRKILHMFAKSETSEECDEKPNSA